MRPRISYLVCATPRSGSTLVCQALKETGVAGRPRSTSRRCATAAARAARRSTSSASTTTRSSTTSASAGSADEPPPRSPLWSRTAYDRYLEWAIEAGTTPNGVFGAKLMWGYFGDFVSLLRNIPAYRDLPLAELLPAVFPDLTFVRVVRANKVRQAVSLWKAVQTATWREDRGREAWTPRSRRRRAALPELPRGAPAAAALPLPGDRAPARPDPGRGGLLGCLLRALGDQAGARPLRELRRRLRAQHVAACSSASVSRPPDGFTLEPRMKRQSDGINDDWARRFSELRLGTEFDLVPTVLEPA